MPPTVMMPVLLSIAIVGAGLEVVCVVPSPQLTELTLNSLADWPG